MLDSDHRQIMLSVTNVLTASGFIGGPSIPEEWRVLHRLHDGLGFPDGAVFKRDEAIIRRGALILHLSKKRFSHWTDTSWDLYVATPANAAVTVGKHPKMGWFQLAENRSLHRVTSLEGPWWDDLGSELKGLERAAQDLRSRWDAAAADAKQVAALRSRNGDEALRAAYEAGRNAVDPRPPSLLSRIRSFLGM